MTLQIKKPDSVLLTPKQAAAMLSLSERYLTMDRHHARANGTPPNVRYVRLGHRTIRYKSADILALIENSIVE